VQNSPRATSKRLRVFSTIIAALTYCVRNAGPLFVLVWFPCALSSACLIGLEWLVCAFPPRMPQWLIFNQFHPPTWLTPVVIAPFMAMAWAFVLSHICDRNTDRGIVTVSGVRIDTIRFELSSAVLIGAGILVVTGLLDGLFQFAQLRLFVVVHPLFEWGDAGTEAWAWSALVLRMLTISVAGAWTCPIAAQVLRTGAFDAARLRSLMRGNRLRLIAIFFLLNVALYQLHSFIRPATERIVQSLDPALSWTLREATIRHALEFPLDIFWMVAGAVTIGIVMDALATPTPSAELGRSATRAA
jgi:hypothetical protein